MTALAKSAIAPPMSGEAMPRLSVARLRALGPAILVCVAVVWTTVQFPQGSGGREPMGLTRDAVPLLAALIAVRPWRTMRWWVLALAALVGTCALAVCEVTTPGWFGANRAASYGISAATFVVVAAYARRANRAYFIAAAVTIAGGIQFCRALVPWWGSRDPATEMIGTFYWHNQFGAFLLAPAILGLALILAGRAPFRFAGWIGAPLAVAGIVYSSSRGSALVLGFGWLVMGVLALRSRRRARRLVVRWLAASAIAVGVTFGFAGPPFFSTWHAPWAAAQARAATGQTLEQNGGVRLSLWHQALIVFEHDPVAGAGYGAMSDEAMKLTPANWPRSPLAHNDYLQAFAEGGVLLGVPFLAACGAIAIFVARRTWLLLRLGTTDPLRAGVVVAATTVMAHAAIDFDWSYPALFATAAAVVGLACAGATTSRSRCGDPVERRSTALAISGATLLIAAVVIGSVAGRHGGISLVYRGAPAATNALVVR